MSSPLDESAHELLIRRSVKFCILPAGRFSMRVRIARLTAAAALRGHVGGACSFQHPEVTSLVRLPDHDFDGFRWLMCEARAAAVVLLYFV